MTDPDRSDPNWWRQAVVYQVYPRSFADENGDGIGDIRGVTSRVPYLAELGVDAIWLSPFYPSPLADGGYDVADYRDVDPRLGSLADFDALVAAAHDRGIRVIVDIVPNHTSSEHAWFREALAAEPGSPARARYVFRDGGGDDGAVPPSTWPSNFGGSAWTRTRDADGAPGQWYLHLFAPEQPDLDWSNPEVRQEFESILRFWSDRGVDGFRVDVAHALVKDLDEPLRPAGPKDFDLPTDGSDPLYDRDEVHEVFEGWRRVFDEYDPPRTAVAEAWVPSSRVARYARPTELGQAFNFDLLRAPFRADEFRRIVQANIALAQESGTSSTWVLSNHDVVRHASRYALPEAVDVEDWLLGDGRLFGADTALGLARARAATLLMLALPGSGYVYQGEELGLPEVAELRTSDIQDPIWTRSGQSRKGRDGCRVPLPWDTSAPAFGFGDAPPHLPQPDWFEQFAASAQDGSAGSTLEMYRAALRLRRRLLDGEDLTWLPSASPEVLVFERHEGWVVATNFSDEPVRAPAGEVLLSSSGDTSPGTVPAATTLWIRPPRR